MLADLDAYSSSLAADDAIESNMANNPLAQEADMAVDLAPDPAVAGLAARTAAFVQETVIPVEERHHGVVPVRRRARASCRRPPATPACSRRRCPRSSAASGSTCAAGAPVFEEAGYTLLGPLALNCAAPDEGNMHLLELIATPEQQAALPRPAGAPARSARASR